MNQQPQTESVNHPPHYNQGELEVIEAIEGLGHGPGFCIGNAIKYLCRYREKHGTEDLRKAEWYVRRLLKREHGNPTTMLLNLAIEIAEDELPGIDPELTAFLKRAREIRRGVVETTHGESGPKVDNDGIAACEASLAASEALVKAMEGLQDIHLASELREVRQAARRALVAFKRKPV